jgi:hypothetical protein
MVDEGVILFDSPVPAAQLAAMVSSDQSPSTLGGDGPRPARLLRVKGIYAFLGSQQLPPDSHRKTTPEALVREPVRRFLGTLPTPIWRRAFEAWCASGYTAYDPRGAKGSAGAQADATADEEHNGAGMGQETGRPGADDTAPEMHAKTPSTFESRQAKESSFSAVPHYGPQLGARVSSSRDATGTKTKRARREQGDEPEMSGKIMATPPMTLEAAHAFVLSHCAQSAPLPGNTWKRGAPYPSDRREQPAEITPRFRATLERRTRQHWPQRIQDMASELGDVFNRRFGMPVNLRQYHVNLFARFSDTPRAAFFGLELTPTGIANERHRVKFGYSALMTYVAAALVQYAGPHPGQVVLDPMCGCGTISVEAAVQWPSSAYQLGGDLDVPSVYVGVDNLLGAVPRPAASAVQLCLWQAQRLPLGKKSAASFASFDSFAAGAEEAETFFSYLLFFCVSFFSFYLSDCLSTFWIMFVILSMFVFLVLFRFFPLSHLFVCGSFLHNTLSLTYFTFSLV